MTALPRDQEGPHPVQVDDSRSTHPSYGQLHWEQQQVQGAERSYLAEVSDLGAQRGGLRVQQLL